MSNHQSIMAGGIFIPIFNEDDYENSKYTRNGLRDSFWLNDPLKMVYCSIERSDLIRDALTRLKNGNIPLNEARQYMRIERR